jgi:hypothetical protein
MNGKIKKGSIPSYTTTDNKVFSGKDSKNKAERHQRALSKEKTIEEFDQFMRQLFGIKAPYDPVECSDEEKDFCENIMKSVVIYAEDNDFRGEVSGFILDLFNFIGSEKWAAIHTFLDCREE